MSRGTGAAVLLVVVVLAAGCSSGPAQTPVAIAGDRDGLTVAAQLTSSSGSLHVAVVVRNGRTESAFLVPDQCGRIAEVVLARTQFEPEGSTWSGSAQAVKELILDDQRSRQHPDRFHPRLPGDTSSEVPECVRPDRPAQLAPGQEVAERWELPLGYAYSLLAVGSAASMVRVEVVEARAPDRLEFLDMLPTGGADEERAGRNLRVDQPVAGVIDRPAPVDDGKPSLGELYDRLLEDAALKGWIDAQPAESWRLAVLTPPTQFTQALDTEQVRLRLVTTEFERAAHVTARADGTDVAAELPADVDRARDFERRPGTLPPGIALIEEPDSYALGEDLFPGSLMLPSGRVVVGEFLFDAEPLDLVVPAGAYPIHATLASYQDRDWQDVALASLVLSNEPTVRWADMGSFAVDGGSATFTSVEGATLLTESLERDEAEWNDLSERIFDARTAHDYHAVEFPLAEGLNLVEFSSGAGDGGYPVFVGYDAAGNPTRVVVDFYLLHLDWPD